MEIQYFGANCIRIITKKAQITLDDNLADLGQKSVTKKGDIILFTAAHAGDPADAKLKIDQPGEYEVSDISIQGVAARAHMDEEGQRNTTMFKIVAEDIRIVATGHVYPDLSDDQLETLGTVDILILPVGGHGYTLDGIGALKLIKKIEPKIIIPTHYDDKELSFPVPQAELAEALKAVAMEPSETVPKLKLKATDIADVMRVIVLEKS